MQQFVSRRREPFIGLAICTFAAAFLIYLFVHLLTLPKNYIELVVTALMLAMMMYSMIDFGIRFAGPTKIYLEERQFVVETPFGSRYFDRDQFVRVAGIGSLLLFVKKEDGTEEALSIGHWPKELHPAFEAYAARR